MSSTEPTNGRGGLVGKNGFDRTFTPAQIRGGFADATAAHEHDRMRQEIEKLDRDLARLDMTKRRVSEWVRMRELKVLRPVLDVLLAPAKRLRKQVFLDMPDEDLLAERRFAKHCLELAKQINDLSKMGKRVDEELAQKTLARERLSRILTTGRA